MYNQPQRSVLSILQDETRCKILSVVSENPSHPDILVKEIGVSRTAIEKHLKLLLNYGILERRAQTYPRLRYVYSVSQEAEILLDLVNAATEQFVEAVNIRWEEELTQIEQGFVFGALQKDEFEKLKKDFTDRINLLKTSKE